MAPYYDAFQEHPAYPSWVRRLAGLGIDHGASGGRLLDVACGTGKSLEPLVEDGWTHAVGVDAVPEMLEMARQRLGDRAELVVGDMTRLDRLGAFDLVTCLNDPVNCLLTPEAVERAMAGLAANLAPDGVLVFDVTTPATYRAHWASDETRHAAGMAFRWLGRFDGEHAVAELTARGEEDGEVVATVVHVQRYHDASVIERALRAAGLEVTGLYGCDFDGMLAPPDEEAFKHIYVVKRTVHPPS